MQWNRFADTVVLQITNDNIVCTHYAVSLNDRCQQKRVWIWCVSFSLFPSAFVFRMLTRQQEKTKPSTCSHSKRTNTHMLTNRQTRPRHLYFWLPALSSKKAVNPCWCLCFFCFQNCLQSLISMSSVVCSVYETWCVTAPHSQKVAINSFKPSAGGIY